MFGPGKRGVRRGPHNSHPNLPAQRVGPDPGQLTQQYIPYPRTDFPNNRQAHLGPRLVSWLRTQVRPRR